MDADQRHMRRAVRLAHRGLGSVEPNPPVGCVIVRDGVEVGSGWHRSFGGPHAEIEALQQAGHQADGATVYVTLEPCNHEGKTPPCVDALIDARVRRVVIGAADPNPEAAGGIAKLRTAGITVDVGVERDAVADLIRAFTCRQQRGRPWVIGKWAQTLDGAIATHTGDSQWISSPASRREVHRLRARCDAILVGIGTVLADDPLLTARRVRIRRRARRVVVDPMLRIPEDGQLLNTLDQAPLTVAASEAAVARSAADKADRLRQRGVAVVPLPAAADAVPGVADDRRLDLAALLRHLAEAYQATWVLCEGGGGLHASMLAADLVDELWVFTAPRVLGGGRPALSGSESGQVTHIAGARPWRLRSVRRREEDVWSRYERRRDRPGV